MSPLRASPGYGSGEDCESAERWPPDGCSPGLGDAEAVAGAAGVAVGSGRWRQMGMFGFGVGVAGTYGVGVSFGVGNGVGNGCGGTRGSGKRGSLAADSASERFQSGPNGPADSVAAGDAAVAVTDCSPCPVA